MRAHTEYNIQHGRAAGVRPITENAGARWTPPAWPRGWSSSAMHITAAVWVNDDEAGLHEDTLEWLDKVAPPSWKDPANEVARVARTLATTATIAAARTTATPTSRTSSSTTR